MDLKQLLPILLNGNLGETEKAILKASQGADPAALGDLLTQMYKKQPRIDLFATLKKIMPAQTLGQIIKYYDQRSK